MVVMAACGGVVVASAQRGPSVAKCVAVIAAPVAVPVQFTAPDAAAFRPGTD